MTESVMQKVERFRNSIATAKTDKTRLDTQLEAVDDDLKAEFNADTPDQAKEVLAKEVAAEARLAKEVTTGRGNLEEKFDW